MMMMIDNNFCCSKMTPHSLKVENCSSHCTTPSERIAPDLIPIKVGCFHINLASSRGRRIFLLQMLVLCFVPHAALIMQNCTIMAQLSQTLDSSVNLNAEVNTILSLSELVVSLEDERLLVTQCLFSDDTQVDK
ncbi:hypothetical protein O3G_MSEX007836 [Manduca sexta]|uniref:Uncharacterized protein n=1 Tax=Manduca sexta TaxID=7130 RepID=A0A921Z9A9_MANSE|nr:hypothetical protein O3G_MSEX007836 [Manduca sexta]